MTKVILRLEITEIGKTVQTKHLTLENNSPLIIKSDFFLSPHLSISLPEDQPLSITFHSEEESRLSPEPDVVYSYTYHKGNHMPIPKAGADFYTLQKGDTFSITKTQKDYYQVIKAEVTLVDLTPHTDPTFPEEIYVSP